VSLKDGGCLIAVVGWGAGAMGIDVVNAVGIQPSIRQCLADGFGTTNPTWSW